MTKHNGKVLQYPEKCLHADKCQPPYSGGCGFMNRECLNTELGGAYCGDCMPGFSIKVFGGECTLSKSLSVRMWKEV